MALLSVTTLPLMQLVQQYILQRFVDQMSAEHGVNSSSSSTAGESQCFQSNATQGNSTYDVMKEAQSATAVYLTYLSGQSPCST